MIAEKRSQVGDLVTCMGDWEIYPRTRKLQDDMGELVCRCCRLNFCFKIFQTSLIVILLYAVFITII